MNYERRLMLAGAVAGFIAPTRPVTAGTARKLLFTPAETLGDEERRRHERHMTTTMEGIDDERPPFVASIVNKDSGEVMCHGHNHGGDNPIYHGEMDALIKCGEKYPGMDWSKATIYTTGEPCPMCMGAIIWSGIPRVVYATSIKTLTNIGLRQIGLDSSTVAGAAPFYGGEIVGGVLEERTDKIFEQWWASR